MKMLNERLARLREEAGYTKKEVANILNIDPSTYGKYELGKRQPDYETLIRLAELFNVSVDFLLGKTDIRNPADEFLVQAKEQYGSRGKKQAEELLENIQTMFEGGELPDEDKDEFFRAITEIYFDAKEKNKKYTPKKYRKNNNEE